MFKCKQKDCTHESKEKGFCPNHGDALEESASQLDDILGKIHDVVKSAVKNEVKDLDLVQRKDIFPKDVVPQSKAQKYELVKELVLANPTDKSAFEGCMGEKEQNEFLAKARIANFFKHMVAFNVTKDPANLGIVKALAEGVDADGGYLVPTEFRAELIRTLRDLPFLRNWVTVIPMNTNSLEMPTQTTNVTVSWGSENTSISTTTAAFGTLTFTPYRLNSLMYTSRELVADSALAIVPLITQLFVEAIGLEEDHVIVNGSGSGQPKGILQETLAGIDNSNDDSTIADNIKKLPYRLPKRYRQNAKWLANPLALEKISVLKDTYGQYLLKTLEEGDVQTLTGKVIEEQSDMPVDQLLLGDFKQYYLADRQQISIESTTEGAGAFEKHQVAIKIVERIDGKVAVTGAFRKVTNCGFD